VLESAPAESQLRLLFSEPAPDEHERVHQLCGGPKNFHHVACQQQSTGADRDALP